ncbi:MAG: nascent polypeptide-associated complex subunit beta [Amphiamblys sp. WSBS2006]|nr:MAG: nascent polypeptide-associated complex subunit beta [Amphiamblys sp. WSBS2006]
MSGKEREQCEVLKIGGRTVRRVVKKQGAPENTANGEKRVQEVAKKISGAYTTTFSEVSMFTEDDGVLHFANPKMYLGKQGTFFGVVGTPEKKTITDMVSRLLPHLDQGTRSQVEEMLEKEHPSQEEATEELREVSAE